VGHGDPPFCPNQLTGGPRTPCAGGPWSAVINVTAGWWGVRAFAMTGRALPTIPIAVITAITVTVITTFITTVIIRATLGNTVREGAKGVQCRRTSLLATTRTAGHGGPFHPVALRHDQRPHGIGIPGYCMRYQRLICRTRKPGTHPSPTLSRSMSAKETHPASRPKSLRSYGAGNIVSRIGLQGGVSGNQYES